jgi:hypothetical protein
MKRQESLNKTRESAGGAILSSENNHSAPGLIHMALKLDFAKEKRIDFVICSPMMIILPPAMILKHI